MTTTEQETNYQEQLGELRSSVEQEVLSIEAIYTRGGLTLYMDEILRPLLDDARRSLYLAEALCHLPPEVHERPMFAALASELLAQRRNHHVYLGRVLTRLRAQRRGRKELPS